MLKRLECPVCSNKGLKIELKDGEKIITSGKPLKDYNCVAFCSVCKRKIKYDIVKEEKVV